VAALAALAVVSACSTTKPASAAGASYCAGRTVTFLAPDDPGGNSDLQLRVLGPAISKILGCDVKVTDSPQGDTVVGQDLVAHAKPDGLTVGYLQVSKDVYNEGIGKQTIDFKADSVQFLASTNGTPNVIIAAPNSPYKTFQDIINSPTPVPILTTGGSGSMTITMLMAAYGKKPKFVKGYNSSADLVQGFLRGDGPVTNSALSALATIITDGKAKAILMDTQAPPGDLGDSLKSVPVYDDLLKETPPPTAEGMTLMQNLVNYRAAPSDWYFVPAGTPQNIVDQLRTAFGKALRDSDVQKKLAALGVDGYVPGTDGLKYVQEMEAIIPDIKKYAS
jgi:tripartite-type tricarboxylate transporter receptor subunit TctC